MEFLHAADVHLGYQQYGSKERLNDFSKAFLRIITELVIHRVGSVLLFHERTVNLSAMRFTSGNS